MPHSQMLQEGGRQPGCMVWKGWMRLLFTGWVHKRNSVPSLLRAHIVWRALSVVLLPLSQQEGFVFMQFRSTLISPIIARGYNPGVFSFARVGLLSVFLFVLQFFCTCRLWPQVKHLTCRFFVVSSWQWLESTIASYRVLIQYHDKH